MKSRRYSITKYAEKMGVSKQYISKWVKEGKLESEYSREMGRILVLDTVGNKQFFMNPHPTRGGKYVPAPIDVNKLVNS